FISRGAPDIMMLSDMGFMLFKVLVKQGAFVQVVFEDVFDAHIGGGIRRLGSSAGVVESLGALGFMELEESHGSFVAYLRIIPLGQDRLHTAHHMGTVAGRLALKEVGTPIAIVFMGAAQVLLVGNIRSPGHVALMQCDALMPV